MFNGTELRVFECPNGHTWDVFGELVIDDFNENEGFVPQDLQLYLCPTCDAFMEDCREPENLT